jgi:transcriptional regulator with XRE-family HTH domain
MSFSVKLHWKGRLAEMVGDKIRGFRRSKGMTLTELSEKTGLSASLLSQVENKKTSPSIATLRKIAMALEISIVHFFEGDHSGGMVVRKGDRMRLSKEGSHILYQLLTPNLSCKIETILIELDPELQDFDGPSFAHVGEESIYVIEGALKLELDGVLHIINEGDAIYFDSGMTHRIANAAQMKTTIICSVTPPSF